MIRKSSRARTRGINQLVSCKRSDSRPDLLIKENFAKSKRSQVTLFVILAIVIVAVIVLIFLFRGSSIIPGIGTRMPSVQIEMQSCAKTAVIQAVNIMLPQGGYLSPENYKIFNDNKVAYLCYNQNYYAPCINQEPRYIDHLAEEIKSYITNKVEDCFYKLQQDYQGKGYSVTMGETKLGVNLNPKQIQVTVDKKVEIVKGEENVKYNQFIFNIESPVYDLGVIANEIVGGEARECGFDYFEFSKNYPRFKITRTFTNENTRIYMIDEQLQFATRSCALPGGY